MTAELYALAFYLIGSLCFAIGTLIMIWRAIA